MREEPDWRRRCGQDGEAVGRMASGLGHHARRAGPRPAWRQRLRPGWEEGAERPSGPVMLGRSISEKKQKENRNRLGCQGLLRQNRIRPPQENKNCF
jgi:hypothetical protein